MGNSESSTSEEKIEKKYNKKEYNKYNILVDIPDIRDYSFSISNNQIYQNDLKYNIELLIDFEKKHKNPIINLITYILYLQLIEFENKTNSRSFYPSSSYIEYILKISENIIDINNGLSIKTILKCLNKYGIIPEDVFIPNQSIIDDFTFFINKLSIKYYRIEKKNSNMIKSLIIDNKILIFNFSLYSSFEDMRNDNIIPYPNNDESLLGCYVGILLGYNDELCEYNVLIPTDNNEEIIKKISYKFFENLVNDIWLIEMIIKKDLTKTINNIKKNNKNKLNSIKLNNSINLYESSESDELDNTLENSEKLKKKLEKKKAKKRYI